jgi:hypothetical protein
MAGAMNKRNNTICVAAALVALASLSCVKKISDEHSEVQSPIILEKPQDPPFQDQLAADLRAYLSGSTESSITKPILINPNQRAFPIKVTATKNDDPCLRDFALQVYNSMISTKEDVVINGERIIIMGADPEQFSLVENMDDQPISTNIASIGTSPYVLSIRISVLNGDISSTLYIVPLVESTCKQNRPGPCFESIEGATVVQRNPFHSIKRYDDVCRKPDTRVSQVPDSKKIADCDHSTSSKESCMSQRTNQYTDCLRQFSSHKDIIKIASEAAKDPGALNVDKIQRKVDASHINSAEKKVLSERCLTPLELRRRKITILTALTANIGGDGTIQRFHAGGGLYFGLGLPVKRTQRLVIRPGLNYRANQYTEAYLAPGDLNRVQLFWDDGARKSWNGS